MWDPRTELITKLGNKKFYQLGQIATMKEVNVCNSEPLGFKNLMSALCSGEILVDITWWEILREKERYGRGHEEKQVNREEVTTNSGENHWLLEDLTHSHKVGIAPFQGHAPET